MDTNSTAKELIAQRMAELPNVVQDAITSADLEKRLRDLANTHKLHIDQWQKLENEVMLALLGFQPIESLESNFAQHVGVDTETARSLATSANSLVFVPIREELERELEHPDAKEKEVSDVEAAKNAALSDDAQSPASTTTPTTAPEVKVTRPSESTNYQPGQTSAARAAVHDDPYREAPL